MPLVFASSVVFSSLSPFDLFLLNLVIFLFWYFCGFSFSTSYFLFDGSAIRRIYGFDSAPQGLTVGRLLAI